MLLQKYTFLKTIIFIEYYIKIVFYNMKKIFFILIMSIILPENIQDIKSYYIYLFQIDNHDKISLVNTKYVNKKLKKSSQHKGLNEFILIEVLDSNNQILYSDKLSNPKLIYSEDIQNGKKDFYLLKNTYFTIKIPAFKDLKYLEFYLSSKINNLKNKKLNTTIIDE